MQDGTPPGHNSPLSAGDDSTDLRKVSRKGAFPLGRTKLPEGK
jgi:hypothetical protein